MKLMKLMKIINQFNQVAGYKINTKQTIAFLHANNELDGEEIKKFNSFIISPSKIKYMKINLTRQVKDLY